MYVTHYITSYLHRKYARPKPKPKPNNKTHLNLQSPFMVLKIKTSSKLIHKSPEGMKCSQQAK